MQFRGLLVRKIVFSMSIFNLQLHSSIRAVLLVVYEAGVKILKCSEKVQQQTYCSQGRIKLCRG